MTSSRSKRVKHPALRKGILRSDTQLIRRARQLPHRKRVPVVMLSASDVEAEAWRAGADAFLKKPDDIRRLTEMVARLLSKNR